MITELKFIKSSAETEMVKVIEIVEITVMILASEKWLLKVMTVLNLTDAALTAAII